MKINKMIKLLTVLTLMLIPVLTNAQPGEGGGDPGAPIDGGLGVLIAAGAAYGVKKYREGRKKNETGEDGMK